MRATDLLIGATSIGLGAVVLACGGLGGLGGGGFACGTQQSNYEETIGQEGLLVEDIAAEGPYPMAMVISQAGVNDLLTTVLGQDLPPVRQDVAEGLSFTARPDVPKVVFDSFDDCANCVRTRMAFTVDVDAFGANLDGNRGAINLRVPIQLAPRGNTATSLMAHLEEAQVEDIDIEIAGLNSNDFREIEDALEVELRNYIRSEFGATEIVQLDSWAIGDGDVLLAARGPIIDTEKKTILLGLHSNLSLPTTATLEQQTSLPDGVPMSLTFHPDLLLAMGQRMMHEGHVPRDYDEDGEMKESGNHHVSLMNMATSDGGNLQTDFRIWRTGGGLCGFADVSAALGLTVTDTQVHIEAQDLQVTGGEGSGELIAENQWLAGDFMQSLTEQIELTVNYREVDIEGEDKTAAPEATLVEVDGRGVTVFLNLNVIGGGDGG